MYFLYMLLSRHFAFVLIIWIAEFFIVRHTLNFLLHYVKLLLLGMVLQFAFILCLSKGNKFRDFYYLVCFSVYSYTHCFCSIFQNFAGDTCSWDFQVMNWRTFSHICMEKPHTESCFSSVRALHSRCMFMNRLCLCVSWKMYKRC